MATSSTCTEFLYLNVFAMDANLRPNLVGFFAAHGPNTEPGFENTITPEGHVVALPKPGGPYHLEAKAGCYSNNEEQDDQTRLPLPALDLEITLDVETLSNTPDRQL